MARIALCHEWLWARHGSEKTFEAMASALPGAELYALTWNRSSGLDFGGRPVHTTLLDLLPEAVAARRRALVLPLMPIAWRYATRRRYDVVVTSSHACVKGFGPGRRALHLCYCYTPMRYVWLSGVDSRRKHDVFTATAERWLKSWDLASLEWVDEFAAISTAVQKRIHDFYGREARLIHPPVDVDRFAAGDPGARQGFALAVSRMVPYKRLDLAIRASHIAGLPLVVSGAGPEEGTLRNLAGDLRADVRFVGEVHDGRLAELYRSASVVVFPAEEDFGMVAVEAQASGTPVVAYGRGGSRDTVVPGITGELVGEQDPEAFAGAMRSVVQRRFDPAACRHNAERFSPERFAEEFVSWVLESARARGIELDNPRVAESV